MEFTDNLALLLKAVHFAAHKHRYQRRKDEEALPYINHPIEVAEILPEVSRYLKPLKKEAIDIIGGHFGFLSLLSSKQGSDGSDLVCTNRGFLPICPDHASSAPEEEVTYGRIE